MWNSWHTIIFVLFGEQAYVNFYCLRVSYKKELEVVTTITFVNILLVSNIHLTSLSFSLPIVLSIYHIISFSISMCINLWTVGITTIVLIFFGKKKIIEINTSTLKLMIVKEKKTFRLMLQKNNTDCSNNSNVKTFF